MNIEYLVNFMCAPAYIANVANEDEVADEVEEENEENDENVDDDKEDNDESSGANVFESTIDGIKRKDEDYDYNKCTDFMVKEYGVYMTCPRRW